MTHGEILSNIHEVEIRRCMAAPPLLLTVRTEPLPESQGLSFHICKIEESELKETNTLLCAGVLTSHDFNEY